MGGGGLEEALIALTSADSGGAPSAGQGEAALAGRGGAASAGRGGIKERVS